MKKLALMTLASLVVAAGIVYFTLIAATYAPEGCDFRLDLRELRELASSMPGDKPSEVRVEDVTGNSMPQALAVPGTSWDKVTFRAYAYQIVFPDMTVIVDTAMTEDQANELGMKDGYDQAAWERVAKGMTEASAVYVTHEHADHLGGAVANDAWAKNVRLTPAQRDSDTPSRAKISDAVRATPPLAYAARTVVAPGVVLIAVPGHTPGSQLVYVQRADGAEVILTGDTAWLMANIERQQPPIKLAFLVMKGSDRHANSCQLAALDNIRQNEQSVAIMTGHDKQHMETLLAKGVFVSRFK